MTVATFFLSLGLQLVGAALALIGSLAFAAATPGDIREIAVRLPALARLTDDQLRLLMLAFAGVGFIVFVLGAARSSHALLGQ